MKKIFITGVSGTGKSTVSKKLNERNITSFDIDALSYWRHKETIQKTEKPTDATADWLDNHEWVCLPEDLDKEFDKYKDKDIIVVVGVTRNKKDYLHVFDKILLLHCNEDTLRHRLNTRIDNDFGKSPEEQQRVIDWSTDFQEKLLNQGAIAVTTEEPLDVVIDTIINHIHN